MARHPETLASVLLDALDELPDDDKRKTDRDYLAGHAGVDREIVDRILAGERVDLTNLAPPVILAKLARSLAVPQRKLLALARHDVDQGEA